MIEQNQKVALPAYLLKRLEAFRLGKDTKQKYLIRDKFSGKNFDFEPWQFFVLEVLPGCDDYAKLASILEDRFGQPVTPAQVNELFATIADNNLLAEDAATHPLLAAYSKKTYEVEGGKAKVKSFRAGSPEGNTALKETLLSPTARPIHTKETQAEPASVKTDGEDESLPAGVQDAVGLDARTVKKMWTLFDPRPMLKLLSPWVAPLRFSIYVLPLLAIAAIFLAAQYAVLIREDMTRLLGNATFFGHAFFSMFTVNLLVTLTTAFIAHNYRATVSAIGIAVFTGFLPRFVPQISHVRQLSRRERMWLHAAPLLLRLGLFSFGILLWYSTRATNGLLPHIGLTLAVICAIALLFSINPLVKSSGYHLLAAFVNEPHLRGKSYKALMNRLHGTVYKEADNSLLAAYGLASLVFMFVLMIGMILFLGVWLKKVQLGGSAIIVVAVLGVYLGRRTLRRFRRIEAAYERSVQFDRWRKRTLPVEVAESPAEKEEQTGLSTYAKRALLLGLLIILFLPYPYQPGGKFVIFPHQQQVIAVDVPGVVAEVYFEGGEAVKKDTVIARLANKDDQSQLKVLAAQLDVATTHAGFSKAKAARIEKLYKAGAVSFEEWDTARRIYEIDVSQVTEKRAALELVQDKIDRSVLIMPFDGNIMTLHLKQKINSYLDKGQIFAAVESSGPVTAEIEVPESDIGFITGAARVQARPMTYSDQLFEGVVTTIDRNVTVQPFGNVIKVVALISNDNGKLKTGMTGYAKIEGPSLPVWKAFSLAVLRFFSVQVWSWIP